MKRTLALLLILFLLPMTRTQMIRRIRCRHPEYTYEELAVLSPSALRSMLPPGI